MARCDTSHVFLMNLYRFVVRITSNSWLWPWVMRTITVERRNLAPVDICLIWVKVKKTYCKCKYMLYSYVVHIYNYIYIYIYVQRCREIWHEIWVRTWDSPYQLVSWISSIKHILQNDPRIMNPLLVFCVNQGISMRLMCLYSSFLLFLLYIGFVWEKVTSGII